MELSEERKRQIIEEFYNSGLSRTEFSRQVGISRKTLYRILKKEETQKINSFPQFFIKNNKKTEEDVFNILSNLVERTKAHNNTQDYSKIKINSKAKTIAIIKAADLHLGGLDVSYEAFIEHYKFLLQEENFYLQLFGDDINIMINHPVVGARHDVLTPNEQCELFSAIIDILLKKGKLLSLCWGNHSSEFSERTIGIDLIKLLVGHKVPYFRGLGYIDLEINGIVYPMAFTHKVRYNSFMNALHGNKRMEQLHAEFFGINRPIAREYITAHTHYPAFSVEGLLPQDRVWFIKVGTFKTNCLYSQRYFGQGRIGCPTVVYHTDQLKHICFPTPWEAYRYMLGHDKKE